MYFPTIIYNSQQPHKVWKGENIILREVATITRLENVKSLLGKLWSFEEKQETS